MALASLNLGNDMKGYPIDLIGERFDKLVVLSVDERTPSGTRWLCRLKLSIALGIIAKMMCPEHGLIVAHGCKGKCDLVFKVKRKAA